MDASPMARSIPDLFSRRVSATPEATAYLSPEGGGWKPLTWKETDGRVRAIAGGLRSLGVEPGDRVGIVSNTRLEWILADLGILFAGGVTVTVYAASTPDDTGFILSDSRSVVVFAEDVGAGAEGPLPPERAAGPASRRPDRHVWRAPRRGSLARRPRDPRPRVAGRPSRRRRRDGAGGDAGDAWRR